MVVVFFLEDDIYHNLNYVSTISLIVVVVMVLEVLTSGLIVFLMVLIVVLLMIAVVLVYRLMGEQIQEPRNHVVLMVMMLPVPALLWLSLVCV